MCCVFGILAFMHISRHRRAEQKDEEKVESPLSPLYSPFEGPSPREMKEMYINPVPRAHLEGTTHSAIMNVQFFDTNIASSVTERPPSLADLPRIQTSFSPASPSKTSPRKSPMKKWRLKRVAVPRLSRLPPTPSSARVWLAAKLPSSPRFARRGSRKIIGLPTSVRPAVPKVPAVVSSGSGTPIGAATLMVPGVDIR